MEGGRKEEDGGWRRRRRRRRGRRRRKSQNACGDFVLNEELNETSCALFPTNTCL
jgi:hypothetical protein